MKKKYIIWILIFIMVLLILLFLFPVRNIYQDGGSQTGPLEVVEQNSDKQMIETIRQRYGEDVILLQEKDGVFTFTKHLVTPVEGDLQFYAMTFDGIVNDNYYDELYRYIGDAYFAQTGRSIEWSITEENELKSYIPILYVNVSNDDSIRSFCEDICNYVEYCCNVETFASDTQYLESLIFCCAGKQTVFAPEAIGTHYDRTQLYNEIYIFVDDFFVEISASDYQEAATQEQTEEVAQEIIDIYLSYEPAFVFLAEDGMEYRMIEADRALGSSYFVLLGTYDNGKTCSFLNRDPFNGSGGTSVWLCFLDEKIGFAGLAYSGGNYGRLYRTEDGGESFIAIELPSSRIKLSDGTYYNPFVMPEKVYEEDGKLYLEVGQGPNGDYYGENGFCNGLYTSEDSGVTWKYSGTKVAYEKE